MAYRFVARRRTDRTASSVPSVSLSGGRMTDEQKLAASIANQQARLQAVGETPKELDKTPFLLKALSAMAKPGDAYRTGVAAAQQAQDAVLGKQNIAQRAADFSLNMVDPLGLRKVAEDLALGRDVATGVKKRAEATAAGAQAFVEGLPKGWKQGEEMITGREMVDYNLPEKVLTGASASNLAPGLRDRAQASGNDLAGKTENTAREIAGFLVEAGLDPTNAVDLGLGTLIKGIATKGTGKMTREAAERLARAQLSRATGVTAERAAEKRVTKAMVDDLAWRTAQAAPGAAFGPVTADALNAARTAAKDTLGKQALAAETSDRIADALKRAGVKGTAPDVGTAVQMIADARSAATKAAAGKGLAIGGKTLVSEENLLKAGGKIRSGIDRTPVLKNAAEKLDKMFNSKYITGATAATQDVMHALKQGMTRKRGALDAQTADLFMRQVKVVKDEAKKFSPQTRVAKKAEFDRDIIHVLEGTKDPATVQPAIAAIAMELKDYYKKIGVEEYEAGILHSVMNDKYSYHALSQDAPIRQARGGNIKGNLRVSAPAAAQREMGNTLDVANQRMRYHLSQRDEQERFVDMLYRHFGQPPPTAKQGGTIAIPAKEIGRVQNELADKWVADQVAAGVAQDVAEQQATTIVKRVGDLYDQAGLSGEATAFSESGVVSFLTRALQHNRVLAAKEFVDEATAAFGTRVSSHAQAFDLAKQGKDIVIPRQSIRQGILLNAGQAGDLEAIGRALDEANALSGATPAAINAAIGALPQNMQDLVRSLLDANADSLIKITPDQWNLLTGEGSALLLRPVISEAYAFEPAVLSSILDATAKQTEAGMETLGKLVDLFYSKWKPLVTGLKAGYHIRNYFGGMANNFLDVGMRAFDPRTSAKAAMTQAKRDAEVLPGYTGKQLWDIAIEKGVMQGTHASEFSDTAAETAMKHLYGPMGGKSGNVAQRAAAVAQVGGDKLIAGSRKAGHVVEGQVRLTNFIANVEMLAEKGVPYEQAFDLASDSVRKFQFDYSDLTKTERNILRRIFPFYSWMRNNIPLQVEQFLNQPGKYVMFARALRDFAPEADKEALPAYMQETMAVPIPGSGTPEGAKYASLNLPMQDLNNLLNPGKTLMSSLAPFIKVFPELTMNKNILTGGPIWKETDPESVQFEKKRNYIIQQFGIIGSAYKAVATEEPKEGSKAVQPAVPWYVPGSSMLKQYNVAPAQEQDKYNLNTLLKNQIAQTEAERDIEVPTMAQIKKRGYQYVPRPSRRER